MKRPKSPKRTRHEIVGCYPVADEGRAGLTAPEVGPPAYRIPARRTLMPAGEIIATVAIAICACFGAAWLICGAVEAHEHRRMIRRRLKEIERLRPMAVGNQSPWGDIIELPTEAKQRAARTLPGEGAVKAARAQVSHRHIAHDNEASSR